MEEGGGEQAMDLASANHEVDLAEPLREVRYDTPLGDEVHEHVGRNQSIRVGQRRVSLSVGRSSGCPAVGGQRSRVELSP